MPELDAAVEAAIEGELRLLDPAVRRSPELLGALLHPDYFEFGSSGRRWDRAAIIAELSATREPGMRPLTVSRMKGVRLAPGLVHLTFETDRNGACAHRSSLWRQGVEGWLLYFHQGTPFSRE
ncbi:nuclear transport factor 2 family protein [Streptomyces sp. NBC_01474]|uniref:Nuclear transport factor 2 family protein n=1 Tax=Streptomyces aureus TaxID=193461 RepID=A0ABV4SFW5_9ACTN|nr:MULTISPECIES: nuclear transport factor 2 family protein [unclassified Streptomyces]WSD95370.1 nuclear transport factor 2 family protein [Streptomyces sp. NBC_01474]